MSWRPPDPWSYSYLLGMYLGDGYVSASRRTYQLVIVCDAAYPRNISVSHRTSVALLDSFVPAKS